MKFLKEPLLHFLLAGFALFIVYYQLNPEDSGADNLILVNEESLMTFIQYRTKTFEPNLAKQRWAKMSAQERQGLVDEFIQEEVLYREAMALGMEQDDYIIKRRLVQKVDFILQSEARSDKDISDKELVAFMAANAADYWVEPYITFTHVYFKGDQRALAKTTLQQLQDNNIEFSGAGEYGERFLYHLNYVERTKEYIAAHFGRDFAEAVFNKDLTDFSQWHGPFDSQHGQHLLFISKRQAGYQPRLEEVRGRVLQDYRRAQQQKLKQEKYKRLLERYTVKTDAGWLGAQH